MSTKGNETTAGQIWVSFVFRNVKEGSELDEKGIVGIGKLTNSPFEDFCNLLQSNGITYLPASGFVQNGAAEGNNVVGIEFDPIPSIPATQYGNLYPKFLGSTNNSVDDVSSLTSINSLMYDIREL